MSPSAIWRHERCAPQKPHALTIFSDGVGFEVQCERDFGVRPVALEKITDLAEQIRSISRRTSNLTTWHTHVLQVKVHRRRTLEAERFRDGGSGLAVEVHLLDSFLGFLIHELLLRQNST